MDDIGLINAAAMDKTKINLLSIDFTNMLFKNKFIVAKEGKQRCLFASAITPDGYVNHIDSIITTDTIYEIRGSCGTGSDILISNVKRAAIERGLYTESYFCALKPGKLEHLIIPEINTAFTTSNDYHTIAKTPGVSINLDKYLNPSIISAYTDTLEYNKATFENLMNKAITTIKTAKDIHDHLESFYITNMNFVGVELCWEKTLAKILEYANN